MKWNKIHHLNSRKLIDSLRLKLDSAMSDQTADETIAEINRELLEAYKAEESFWKQRSRLLWLTLGDRNTGFFHTVSKGRKARNILTVMETSLGDSVYEEDQIAAEIASYFSNIFSSLDSDGGDIVSRALSTCITDELNRSITTIPSAAEIKKGSLLYSS